MGVKKLKLNENMGEIVKAHGYELDAEERYVINIERELSEQSAIMAAIQSVGLPALNDYYQWLIHNVLYYGMSFNTSRISEN